MGLLPGLAWLAPGGAATGGTGRPPRPIRRRGTAGRTGVPGPGGGSTAFVPVPLSWRSTTRQLCGLYPWGSPGQLPLVGAPIGRHQLSRAVVCFDHVSWFLANLIGNPSVLIIARPGLGKSTLSSKLMLWLAGLGYVLLIPGDTKPDYVELTRSLGGEVRAVARSGGAALNPCDPGGMAAAAVRIGGSAGAALLAEAIGRAVVCLAALATALRLLYDRAAAGSEPLIDDLAELLAHRPDAVRAVVLDRGVDAAYDALIDPLQRSLRALTGGQFGDVFTRRVPRRADRPPADEGLAPRRLYCLTLDELWRVLRLGGSMPDRVNELTRLNRTQGVGQIMVTHSIRDLAPGRDSEVEGIEERAGAIVIGGVPKRELDALDAVLTLTAAERSAIATWWSTSAAAVERNEVPPGAGKFLIKASSEDPGLPVDVELTSVERAWGGQNTNRAWTAAPGPLDRGQ